MVTCMALYVSYFDGLDSGSATVAVAIAFIVMYDASHVRLEVGKHASRINKFISYSNNRRADVDLESHGENRDEGKNARDTTPLVDVQTRGKYASSAVNVYSVTEGLEEAVGHTKPEVAGGFAVGVLWFLLWLPVMLVIKE